MSKNPGKIIKLSDGRLVIVYDYQPLALSKNKIVLHLIDENHNHLVNTNTGVYKTLVKSITDFNEEMKKAELIGFVD